MLKSSSVLPPFEHKSEPYDHQVEVLEKSWKLEYYALFMEMGTGKSKVMVDTMSKLFLDRQIDGVLIIAPKGGYMIWEDEVPKHMPDFIPRRFGHWNTDGTKMEERIAYALLGAKDDCLDIMCVNVEALVGERAYQFAETFVRSHYTLIIVDESTCIKNHAAKRTKALYKLRDMADFRRILTGTPITDSPLDLFGQCQFLKKGCLGHDNWVSFQNYFAIVRQIRSGSRCFEMILKYKNLNELTDLVRKFSYRKLKEECLDLPEKVFLDHYVEWTPEQKRAYTAMKEEAMVEFGKSDYVSSTSVFTTMNKLHQINCGHVKTDEDGSDTVIDIPHNRINELLGLLRNAKGKVIIWCQFKKDVQNISEAIHKEFKKHAAVFYGNSSDAERKEAINQFCNGSADHMVLTLAAGCRAITLVQSAYSIYYSYGWNLEHWLQSQDRNHRIGQTKTTVYVVMQVKKTVDTEVIKRLKSKHELATEVIDRDTALRLLQSES